MIYSIFLKCFRYSRKSGFFSNTKKNARSLVAVFVVFAMLPLLLTGCGTAKSSSPVTKSGFYLNTVVTITLYDGSDPTLISECFALCSKYEHEFSRTVRDSALYQLNHDTAVSRKLSDPLQELVAAGLSYYELSDGLFDITVAPLSDLWQFSSSTPSVPDETDLQEAVNHVGAAGLRLDEDTLHYEDTAIQLDLGGIAKGYIADRIKEHLIARGVTSALIDLGGNILCIGEKPDGSAFRVGIRKPFGSQNTTLAVVSGKDISVVTSGIYERYFMENNVLYHHLLDPKTGYPFDTGLNSVSIISKSSVEGDALSTVCFALGIEKGMELINSMPDVYAVFVTAENELVYSEGAKQYLQ